MDRVNQSKRNNKNIGVAIVVLLLFIAASTYFYSSTNVDDPSVIKGVIKEIHVSDPEADSIIEGFEGLILVHRKRKRSETNYYLMVKVDAVIKDPKGKALTLNELQLNDKIEALIDTSISINSSPPYPLTFVVTEIQKLR